MSSFIETRIRDAIVYGTVGGPRFSTQVVASPGGAEQRNSNWDQSLGKWELGERKFTKAQLDELNTFVRRVRGRAVGFRFKDWSDYQCGRSQGVLAATTGGFQLVKNYDGGEQRPILKPVQGTVAVFNSAGAPVAFTLDATTGIASGSAVNASCAWSGEFDVPVRFDTDEPRSRLDHVDRATGEGIFYVFGMPMVELLQP